MKKTILLAFCITLLASVSTMAQSDKKVPAVVTSAFAEKYPGMKVSEWDYEADKNAYQAEFNRDGKKMEAYFAEDGSWMKTKRELKVEDLPPAVFKSLTTGEYKDWTFGDYYEMDTPEGMRYKIKAKYNPQEHHLIYNEAGILVEKKDAKPGAKKKK